MKMKLLSVNEANQKKEAFLGEEVFLHGVLKYTTENVLIEHWPKSEKLDSPNPEIWVHTGNGPFIFDAAFLKRVNSKRVVARGKIELNSAMFSQDPSLWWHTHFSATALTTYKKWQEEHGTQI